MKTDSDRADESQALVERVKPLFAGVEPGIIGATLADLTAMWLAGHVSNTGIRTIAMRERLLRNHTEVVRKLTIINAKMLGTDIRD